MFKAKAHRLLPALLWLVACNGGAPRDTSATLQASQPPTPKAERLRSYPPGHWRLDASRIGDVLIWPSQILIQFDQVSRAAPCFTLADWQTGEPPVVRSRTEALALANDLAARATQAPERFAELARLHSDDSCTREAGGSFGGVAAASFQPWPEVLDALAATPSGSVSRVVETRFGFHIFHRRPPPPEVLVSGARIVIGYRDASWLARVARTAAPTRSRAEALELAKQVYAEAVANPSDFLRLVGRYSEHSDALRAGNIGAWSTREPSVFPREMEALAQLKIGDVTPPMDSAVGFEILQRTAAARRQSYAFEQVRLEFTPELPAIRHDSEASVFEAARSLARQAQQSPDAFASYQNQYCCPGSQEWTEGQGPPALLNALDELAVAQIAKEPVRVGNSFVIVRRLAPSLKPRGALFELPEPSEPNIAFVLAQNGADFALTELSSVARAAGQRLGLDHERAANLSRLHSVGVLFLNETPPEVKPAAYQALQRQVADLLGSNQYAVYLNLLNAQFKRLLLEAPDGIGG